MKDTIKNAGCIGLLVASVLGLGACNRHSQCDGTTVSRQGTITAVQPDNYLIMPGTNYRVDFSDGSRTVVKRFDPVFADGSDLLYRVGDQMAVSVCVPK